MQLIDEATLTTFRKAATLMLALGMMTVSLSAQESQTKDQCQRRINSFIISYRLQINPATRARAVQNCMAGNMDRARALLKADHADRAAHAQKQCLQTLDAFIQKARLTPAAGTLATARRYCAAGDLQRAIGTIKANQGRPPAPQQPAPDAAALATRRCLINLETLVRRTGYRPDQTTYENAKKHCDSGDLEAALKAVQTGTQLPPPPPPPPPTPAECERSLDIYIAKTGISPDEATYAAAKAHCAKGATRRAIETVRGSATPQ
jgi:hypothetical protein